MAAEAVRITPFEPGDLAALETVRRAAFAPVFASFAEILGEEIAAVALARADEEQAALLRRICAEAHGQNVLLARVDGAAVGFVSFSVERESGLGEIGLNAVHPDRAGRGIGTRLLTRALEELRGRGVRVATVSTGGDPSHAAARRMYEKAGFGPALPSIHLYRML